MSKIIILLACVAGLAALLIYAASKPDTFEGNKDVGKGSIQIIDSAPAKVTMKLDMLEPFEGHNVVEFTLAPHGETTEVTWAMRGPSPFMFKLVGIFMNMDRMIGRDFETGLLNLKAKAER